MVELGTLFISYLLGWVFSSLPYCLFPLHMFFFVSMSFGALYIAWTTDTVSSYNPSRNGYSTRTTRILLLLLILPSSPRYMPRAVAPHPPRCADLLTYTNSQYC